jgi:hypothetical protein
MSEIERAALGVLPRVAVAVTHGESPKVVLATNDVVLTRAVALLLVAATEPRSIGAGSVRRIREALLEERWADAVLDWMGATGDVLDGYPDELVWTDEHLDEERVALELRMAPIFRD